MLYPLMFKDVLQEKVWGGTKLKKLYAKESSLKNIGESWEISAHKNGMSIIENGPLKGISLKEIFEQYSNELMGDLSGKYEQFPLLVKFIDADDKLSIQVHPNDAYAKEYENGELGKSEMWYVLDAKPGAKLVVGTRDGVTKEIFREAIESGTVENLVEELPVKKGDVINIPAGMLHAIEDGIVLAEIQQSSDTTYRVYDWNRVGLDGQPRELHTEKALEVIDFEGKISKSTVKGLEVKNKNSATTYYIANKYFAVEKVALNGSIQETTNNIKFYLYTCLGGEGIIEVNNETYKFDCGKSFVIPASIGEYNITGKCELLKSYIPDIDADFIKPLQEAGFTNTDITENIDLI